MPKFVLAYHGKPDIQNKEEGVAHMEAWKKWSQGLGDAVVDPGVPVGPSKTITATGVIDNGGSNPLSGVTIIQAETMEAAIELAKDCPHIDKNATIEIAEAMPMDM